MAQRPVCKRHPTFDFSSDALIENLAAEGLRPTPPLADAAIAPRLLFRHKGNCALTTKGKTDDYYGSSHETKGNENIASLRFPHEKRKIKCAEKYFQALEIEYGMSDGHRSDWWLANQQRELGV